MKSIFPYLAVLFFFFSCQSEEEKYDEETGQMPVLTHEGIDSVLARFETLDFDDLDEDYKTYSNSLGEFETSLKNETFYVVRGKDVFKYIVGEYRIRNFLTRDLYFNENLEDYEANKPQYWLVDKKMLYMMLDLILTLDERGYNKYGFEVRESHRHPKYNTMAGGASKSQHVWGRAVDIVVTDIDNDGEVEKEDKDIVLEIMEEIVGNTGGIGKYPGGMTVHFDSRGYRARWDSY